MEAQQGKSPWLRKLIAFSLFIILAINIAVYFQASRAYDSTIEEASSNGYRLVGIMAQQVELTFFGIDSTLHSAIEHEYYANLFGNTSPDAIAIEGNIRTWVDESPYIAGMIKIDEHGTPIVSVFKNEYAGWSEYKKHSFANDELFSHLREGSDTDYYIGRSFLTGGKPDSLILMGRRITRVDGSFGGVFAVLMDPEFFTSYFNSLAEGSHSHIFLQLIDSSALLAVNTNHYGRYNDITSHVLSTLRKSEHTEAFIESYASNGNPFVIYAYQKLKSLPLVVTVVLNDEDYLKSWRGALMIDLGFLAIFLVFGSILTYCALSMANQIARIQRSEADAILSSQVKSEFLANMSHELRTPLNAIIGFSEMINSGYFGQLNHKQKERVLDINLCGTHLLHLINDILEFSKGNEGKLELVEEIIPLQKSVHEALRMINGRIKGKGISTVVETEDSLPALLGDERKIRQILLNLLSNSVKFTPEGGTITIAIRQNQFRNQIITVSDNGIGIAQENIAVALSVFGQVKSSQSHEGTGLGLPLCRMFAELHGGTLALDSVQGKGTTVQITFPAFRNQPIPLPAA